MFKFGINRKLTGSGNREVFLPHHCACPGMLHPLPAPSVNLLPSRSVLSSRHWQRMSVTRHRPRNLILNYCKTACQIIVLSQIQIWNLFVWHFCLFDCLRSFVLFAFWFCAVVVPDHNKGFHLTGVVCHHLGPIVCQTEIMVFVMCLPQQPSPIFIYYFSQWGFGTLEPKVNIVNTARFVPHESCIIFQSFHTFLYIRL